MTAENPTDALSILTGTTRSFDVAMRGYDRHQVDTLIDSLEDEVRALSIERESAASRSADLAAQLGSSHAQIESLRRQLRTATEDINERNVDTHVRALLDAAHADATKVRAEADAYLQQLRQVADEAAERTRASARVEADQILQAATQRHTEADETFRRRIAEADRYRVEITERTEREVAEARAQEEYLTSQASAERDRLDAEATVERARLASESALQISTAEQDFEIALRIRRAAEAQRSADEIAAAHEQATQMVTGAQAHADQIVADANAEVARLEAHRDQVRAELAGLHGRLADLLSVGQPTALSEESAPPAQ